MEIVQEVAIIVATDRDGRVLMQHRDHDADPEPGRWTPPGGRLEHGETALTAAHRELFEETGLTADLSPCRTVDHRGPHGGVRFHVFTADTDATQRDVVLGEGLDMRFLSSEEIEARDLTTSCRRLLGWE